MFNCTYCRDPTGRHVAIRQLNYLVRKYQECEKYGSGCGLVCLACPGCYSPAAKDVWLCRRTPSVLEQGLYQEIQRVFPNDTLSFEHRHPGDKKSVDVFLLERRVAFQADGKQHAEMVVADERYDQRWLQRRASVVRLFCADSGWRQLIERAREESDAKRVFYICSPSYTGWREDDGEEQSTSPQAPRRG